MIITLWNVNWAWPPCIGYASYVNSYVSILLKETTQTWGHHRTGTSNTHTQKRSPALKSCFQIGTSSENRNASEIDGQDSENKTCILHGEKKRCKTHTKCHTSIIHTVVVLFGACWMENGSKQLLRRLRLCWVELGLSWIDLAIGYELVPCSLLVQLHSWNKTCPLKRGHFKRTGLSWTNHYFSKDMLVFPAPLLLYYRCILFPANSGFELLFTDFSNSSPWSIWTSLVRDSREHLLQASVWLGWMISCRPAQCSPMRGPHSTRFCCDTLILIWGIPTATHTKRWASHLCIQ